MFKINIFNLNFILKIIRRWINDAYEYWDDLRKTSESSKAGVTQLSGYMFSSIEPGIVRVS